MEKLQALVVSVASALLAYPYYEFDSAVQGFHQYQSIWTLVVSEEPYKVYSHFASISFGKDFSPQ